MPPEVLTVPHLLTCMAKLGGLPMSQAAGGWVVPGSVVWAMGRLVTCSGVLSCRCAGHRAAGVRGQRQEDCVSALLPPG